MLEQLYLPGPMVPNLEALRGWGLRRYAREFVYPHTQHAVPFVLGHHTKINVWKFVSFWRRQPRGSDRRRMVMTMLRYHYEGPL